MTALRDVFGGFLVSEGKRNPNLVVLDADLSSSTRTNLFGKAFPDRFFNMGIAEQCMIGAAIGLSISGKMPVVSGFSSFTTGRGWEFLRLVSHDQLNVKVVATHGGFVGRDGSTHHALQDLSLTSILPGMRVLVPADEVELSQMLDFVVKTNGPFFVRLPRDTLPLVHGDSYVFKLGEPDLVREGKDVVLIGVGVGVSIALEAAEVLDASVINLSSVKPIDEVLLNKLVKGAKCIVVIEEHNTYCGVGSIVARVLARSKIPLGFIGVDESFSHSGSSAELLESHGLSSSNVVKKVRSLL